MKTILIPIVETKGACQNFLRLADAFARRDYRVVLAAPVALAEQASKLPGVDYRPLSLDILAMTEKMKAKRMGIFEIPAYILRMLRILLPTLLVTLKELKAIVDDVQPDEVISNHVHQFWFQHLLANIPTTSFTAGYIIFDPVLARLGVSPNMIPQLRSRVKYVLAPIFHIIIMVVWEVLFVPLTWILTCIAVGKVVKYVPMTVALLRGQKRAYAMFPITLGLEGSNYGAVRVVGPFLNEDDDKLPEFVEDFMAVHRNVALVTRSSLTGFADKTAMIVDVLFRNGFDGIIFVGAEWQPDGFYNDDVLFADYVNLQALYRRGIAFAITSAGVGTRNERLAYGIPGPYIPIPGEQWETVKDLYNQKLTAMPLMLEEMTIAELEAAVLESLSMLENVKEFAQHADRDGLKQVVDWFTSD